MLWKRLVIIIFWDVTPFSLVDSSKPSEESSTKKSVYLSEDRSLKQQSIVFAIWHCSEYTNNYQNLKLINTLYFGRILIDSN